MSAVAAQQVLDQITRLKRQLAEAEAMLCLNAGIPRRAADTRIAEIIASATVIFGVSRAQLVGNCRARKFCEARFAVAYVASETAGYSLPRIGRALGDRDHTTILSAIRRAGEWAAKDPRYAERVGTLLAIFTPKSEMDDAGTC